MDRKICIRILIKNRRYLLSPSPPVYDIESCHNLHPWWFAAFRTEVIESHRSKLINFYRSRPGIGTEKWKSGADRGDREKEWEGRERFSEIELQLTDRVSIWQGYELQ